LQVGCEEEAKVAEGPKLAPAVGPTLPRDEGRLVTPPAKTATVKPEPNEPSPKITFENVVHNFGHIGAGSSNPCEFKFTNTGDALLKIKRVQSTCGCTVATLSKKEYAPGESGTVQVTYRAGKYGSRVSKHLYVYSNDTRNPKVRLTIKARVELKVIHKPKELRLSLKRENAGCPKITLTSVDKRPFAVKSFRSPGNCITAAFDRSKDEREIVLEPRVNIEKLRRYLNGRISIRLNHPKCGMVSIPYSVLSRFKIEPLSLMVHGAEPQKPIPRKIWILNNYDEDFEIESTSSRNDTVKVVSREKVGKRYKFELEIMPPVPEGGKRLFTDVLYVKIKDGEKLSINLRGFYKRVKL